jgi:hypothetical protein
VLFGASQQRRIERRVAHQVVVEVDVRPRNVVVLEPGMIPKTPSGSSGGTCDGARELSFSGAAASRFVAHHGRLRAHPSWRVPNYDTSHDMG